MPRMKDDERSFREAVAKLQQQGKSVDVVKLSVELGIEAPRADYLWRRMGLERTAVPAPSPTPASERVTKKPESKPAPRVEEKAKQDGFI